MTEDFDEDNITFIIYILEEYAIQGFIKLNDFA